ncbi:hypothetical protein HID58_047616 [Brassica napus]|uniref:Protein kinase domain-containing protein n=1 Tax=Brassica napus TaxID=3708 RepID=A0ABQ8AZZ9_BRANA|nr:hypothetical protein HID58_047616 [Brassica napus]
MIQRSGEGGRTILVGVKLDAPSRELLTWALVKVAEPGDTVIALHILGNEIVKNSSLLSLVKTFDSVLDVYEGFCNLKQVDLKLKLCRGDSARKIIAREARSFCAWKVIVGVSKTHHTIRSSASLAKYLAKKLPKECWVHAVNNVVSHCEEDQSCGQSLQQALVAARFESCSVCGSDSLSPNGTRTPTKLSGDDDDESHKAKEIVPVKGLEELVRKQAEPIPGWPLLRRAFSSTGQPITTRKQIPVAQWALKLPPRNIKQIGYDSSPDNSQRKLPEELERLYKRFSSTCQFFKYKELVSVTSDFSPDNFIGIGGSSRVYRGSLSNEREVAVKILKQTEDVLNDFVAEIDIITTLHHKNIISLLGFCVEDKNLLLIYNYLSRGSLEENLHGSKKDMLAFQWRERYKVAMGVAEALDYLHNSASQPVIHRDVKSSNILLSDDFEPQLSDFGLARWASISTTHMICSDVAGTFGYLAPEYFMYGKVNDKIDVYAFGVVLLELLSGRKPISNSSLRDNKNNNGDQMQRMVLAATLCIRRSPQARPKMSSVLKLLKGDEDTLEWAMQQVSSSSEESEMLEDEQSQRSDLQSHLNLALLDVEDDSISMGSFEQGVSVEEYIKGRTSRSSSFD